MEISKAGDCGIKHEVDDEEHKRDHGVYRQYIICVGALTMPIGMHEKGDDIGWRQEQKGIDRCFESRTQPQDPPYQDAARQERYRKEYDRARRQNNQGIPDSRS